MSSPPLPAPPLVPRARERLVPLAGAKKGHSRLGELLIQTGNLTQLQLDHALSQQPLLKLPLGKVLLKLGYVTDETMRQALGQQLNIPYLDLEKVAIDRSLKGVISQSYARRYALLPITLIGRTLTVVMDDPTALSAVDELSRLTGFSITIVTASSKAIQRAFKRLYEDGDEGTDVISADRIVPTDEGERFGLTPPADEQATKRADELFRTLLARALESRTSDLHLEILPSGLSIRCRIDGVLRQQQFGGLQSTIDKNPREIVSRIKILAKMDIAERRRPQDGSFQVVVERGGQKVTIDLRVSVIPTYSGESVVIRILDRTRAPKSLTELDLSPAVASRLNALLTRTTGIFLVTGPTGSGKSTTLFSCLMKLHTPEVRILTAEDPVEFVYEGLSQSEVNTDIGNTFATYLRSFLRHDPEVIMVGEIRDQETAEMSFRAAQTGHLLLSTLHTNSAIAALPRLLDLQIEPSLIGSSLMGVISQRLLRRICDACRRPDTPDPARVADFFAAVPEGFQFFKGTGCEACGFTGYKGRMLIADLWVPDDQDLMLITRGATFDDVRRSAERTTLSMAEDAHERLRTGRTTLEELVRVMPYSAVAEHKARFSA